MVISPFTAAVETEAKNRSEIRLAIVLDGVSEKWQNNVLQILARPTVTAVILDGHGAIDAPAIVLSRDQARRLATQIMEIAT